METMFIHVLSMKGLPCTVVCLCEGPGKGITPIARAKLEE